MAERGPSTGGRRLGTTLLAAFAAVGTIVGLITGGVRAQTTTESDAYAWIQYGADGHPHARVIPSDRASCPAVSADDRDVPAVVRAVATAGFDRVLCDATLPLDVRTVRVGSMTLPPVPQHVNRFIVLGDTGCRITGAQIQDCGDARAWPFARIARSIAIQNPRPDLIVHVGDYQHRETACPPGDRRCAGSPFGDNWSAWAVDFFEPGAPLFATAPLIWVRGNHEDCAQAGLGWTRYLAPEAGLTCRTHEQPLTATFADLALVDVDSAAGDETDPDPATFERDERLADAQTHGRETILLTHRPPLAYLAHHGADDGGPHLAAIVAGHVHLFAALPFAGAPPTVIVGTGGDALATVAAPETATRFGAVAEARFGYTVFDRVAGGWAISERDPDGTEHRRCELHARTLHC